MIFLSTSVLAKSKVSIPITNAIDLYTMPIKIGKPGHVHQLAIGTGTSDTFCGATRPYVATSTTIDLHRKFDEEYLYGNATGNWVNDTLTFGNDSSRIVLSDVSIGNVSSFVGFDHFDGMIGLNRVGESKNYKTVWTPMSYMWHRGLLQQNVFSISFKPIPTRTPEKNGVITFGGIDPSRYVGQIYWYPCQSFNAWDWTASISYGTKSLSPAPIMGSFSTAYTLGPALADDLFAKYVAEIPGAVWRAKEFWEKNPQGSVNRYLLKIPKSSISQMKDLCFTTNDRRPWCFTPEAQLIPENQLPDRAYRYSYVSPLGATTKQGATFIMGMKGFERYFSVYDIENYRVSDLYLVKIKIK
ncbi:hypothetical protein CROQUDRAFT_50609 [Cronartium quercuum f. sp. fusiforme G11]|uniref:Peptidase A1 domain-containing protein n=1 Tax=Cronartium quercuum f. sp. fusiforme G11 TaxID=708437 RepID=A0A9P6T968_9BASI|nr:hypothetical protein CROQUDRAFT_50609 [Cronartium quercuum f. sp. fusiforme G11]